MPAFSAGEPGATKPDHGRLLQINRLLVAHHEHAGQQPDGEHDVGEWPGEGDDEPLPARLGRKLARVAGMGLERVFARHLDVAAEGQGVKTVIGFAVLDPEQPFAEADGKLLHPHVEQFGRGKMPELVDHDHDPEHDGNRRQVDKEIFHQMVKESFMSLLGRNAAIGCRSVTQFYPKPTGAPQHRPPVPD